MKTIFMLLVVQRLSKMSALVDKSMTFLTYFVHATSFIFRCGGKSDLTSDDRERSNEEWPPV